MQRAAGSQRRSGVGAESMDASMPIEFDTSQDFPFFIFKYGPIHLFGVITANLFYGLFRGPNVDFRLYGAPIAHSARRQSIILLARFPSNIFLPSNTISHIPNLFFFLTFFSSSLFILPLFLFCESILIYQ